MAKNRVSFVLVIVAIILTACGEPQEGSCTKGGLLGFGWVSFSQGSVDPNNPERVCYKGEWALKAPAGCQNQPVAPAPTPISAQPVAPPAPVVNLQYLQTVTGWGARLFELHEDETVTSRVTGWTSNKTGEQSIVLPSNLTAVIDTKTGIKIIRPWIECRTKAYKATFYEDPDLIGIQKKLTIWNDKVSGVIVDDPDSFCNR